MSVRGYTRHLIPLSVSRTSLNIDHPFSVSLKPWNIYSVSPQDDRMDALLPQRYPTSSLVVSWQSKPDLTEHAGHTITSRGRDESSRSYRMTQLSTCIREWSFVSVIDMIDSFVIAASLLVYGAHRRGRPATYGFRRQARNYSVIVPIRSVVPT